jgi:hypothetical protein
LSAFYFLYFFRAKEINPQKNHLSAMRKDGLYLKLTILRAINSCL